MLSRGDNWWFKPRELMLSKTHTSMLAEGHGQFCNNEPVDGSYFRPESDGTWNHDPFDSFPNVS